MTDVASAPAQSTGLPPVEDEDIRPKSDQQDEGGDKDSKTEKRDGSQPPKEAKEKGPGPWTQKLAEAGLNDPRFDEFLRNEIQPYITQLEQGGAGSSDGPFGDDVELAEAAFDLITELRTDPQRAYQELGELLGLTDTSESMDDAPVEDDDLGYEDEQPEDERLTYVQQMMEKEEQQKQDAELNEFLDALESRVEGFDKDLYVAQFVAANGDLDIAWNAYMKLHDRYGLAERARAAQAETAPNVLGPDGGTPPPEEPQYSSIGDAMDSFLSEERARKSRR